jgi:hypothetical protein
MTATRSLDEIPATQTAQPQPLLGMSLSELTAWVQQQGQPAYRGKQLYQWLYQQGARSLAEISVFSKAWRSTCGGCASWAIDFALSIGGSRWHGEISAAAIRQSDY